MADRRVTFLIGANIRNFQKNLNKAQAQFRKFGRKMERTGQSLTQNLTVPIAAIGGLALKTAADFESLQASMDVLNGSAKEGARVFERLKRFAATTPFQLQELAKAQNTLQGFGLSADEAHESLKDLGDIASIMGSNMDEVIMAFGQAAAEGRLMTRDIRQLINQGIPATELLAKSMGVAQSSIFDLASQGKITFEVLQKAIDEATSKGGKFANGMKKASDTLRGVFSNIKDNALLALGEIGMALDEAFGLKEIGKSLSQSLQKFGEWFSALLPRVKKMAFTIAGLLGASGPIMIALGTLSAAIGAISLPVTAAVAAVGLGVTLMIKHWDKIVSYLESGAGSEMWENLKDTAQDTFEVLGRVWESFVGAITRIWDLFGEDVINIFTGVFTQIKGAMELSFNALSIVLDTFTGRWLTDWDGYLKDTEESFSNIFGKDGALATILDGFFTIALSRSKNLPNLFGKLVIDDNGVRWVTESTKAMEKQGKAAKNAAGGFMLYKDALMGIPSVLDNVFGAAKGQGPLLPEGRSVTVDADEDSGGGGNGGGGKQINPFARAENPINRASSALTGIKLNTSKVATSFIGNLKAMRGAMTLWEQYVSDGVLSTFEKWRLKGEEFKNAIVPMVEAGIENMAGTFLEGVGKMMAGAQSVGGIFNSVMTTLANLAVRVGKIAIGVAVAIEGIKKALQTLNPVAALAAGIALIALGSWAKSALSKAGGGDDNSRRRSYGRGVPGMASGGIVPAGFPNDTYPAMLTSGEMVIPSPESLPANVGGGRQAPSHIDVYVGGRKINDVVIEEKYRRSR